MRRSVSSCALIIGGLLALAVSPMSAADASPAASPAASGAPAGVPLEGTTWQLTNLRLSGAYAPVPLGALTTLTLKDGTASGSGGCNQYSVPYTLDGEKLTFGAEIVSTLMLCEGAGGMVETFYFADLPAVATWTIQGDALTLSADDGQPVVAFAVQTPQSPEGSWVVTSYANGTGAIVSVPDDSVSIVFDATTVSGTAGCNGFSGSWTLTDGTLAITPLMSTKMACADELMAREAAVMADLEASTTVSAGPDGGIELHDATGALRLSLSPALSAVKPSGSTAA